MTERGPTASTTAMPGHLIRRLHQLSSMVFARRVREAGYDLTPVQFCALDMLRFNPGIDQAGLAQAIAKDRATIGGVVDRLEQKGLVKRPVSRRDRRARALFLTAKGEETLTALMPVVEDSQKEILPGLEAAEYRQFVELAAKVAQAARAQAASEA